MKNLEGFLIISGSESQKIFFIWRKMIIFASLKQKLEI